MSGSHEGDFSIFGVTHHHKHHHSHHAKHHGHHHHKHHEIHHGHHGHSHIYTHEEREHMPAVSKHEVDQINKQYEAEQKRLAALPPGLPIPSKPITQYTWKATNENVPTLSQARKMLGLSSGPGTAIPANTVPAGTRGATFGAEAMDAVIDTASWHHTHSDWRKKSPRCVGPHRVRNQGKCGSCYGVSSATTVTNRWCIPTNKREGGGKGTREWASEPIIGCTKGCKGNDLASTWQRWAGFGSVPLHLSPYISGQGSFAASGPGTPWCNKVFYTPLSEEMGNAPPSGPSSDPSSSDDFWNGGNLAPAADPIQPFAVGGSTSDLVAGASLEAKHKKKHHDHHKKKHHDHHKKKHYPDPHSYIQMKVVPSHWTSNVQQTNDPYAVVGATGTLASNARKMIRILNASPGDGGGPIQVGFTVMRDFMSYKGGVYQPLSTDASDVVGGHAVMVVGHGYDESAGPYWLVQNSWGTSWGDGGFFKIRMYLDKGDIPDIANFMVFEETAHVGKPMPLTKIQVPTPSPAQGGGE